VDIGELRFREGVEFGLEDERRGGEEKAFVPA
jgi:hypothetical protein